MRFLLISLLLISSAFAQVYNTSEGSTHLQFAGSILKEGSNTKSTLIFRNTPEGKQDLSLVLEVDDFEFSDNLQLEVFQDAFDTQYFPQMRFKAYLPQNFDMSREGIQMLEIPFTISIRKRSFQDVMKISFEVRNKSVFISAVHTFDLKKLEVPYAGRGSEVGELAKMFLKAELKDNRGGN